MNVNNIVKNSVDAKKLLKSSKSEQRNKALKGVIEALKKNKRIIIQANSKDLEAAAGIYDDAFLDRMKLDDRRFEDLIRSAGQILELKDMVGRICDRKHQNSGITTSKMTIPLGILLMVYESRPNVTIDAAALAIKTGNVMILKGGREINHTNEALGKCIAEAVEESGLPKESIQVLSDSSHKLIKELLKYDKYIDLIIPRGSRRLLKFVQENSSIPLLMHLEGNCHIYVDKNADLDLATKIILDAKTQRPGTCNALESLLIHRDVLNFLPKIVGRLKTQGVEIRGDKHVIEAVKFVIPAANTDWSKEYLGPVISIKTVKSTREAIDHINQYGSGHTDSVITKNQKTATQFLYEVESSSVMVNTSTRLADGFEYGLGAEIGISTNKLHARGPVGQEGLLTYKWIVESDGVIKGDIVNS